MRFRRALALRSSELEFVDLLAKAVAAACRYYIWEASLEWRIEIRGKLDSILAFSAVDDRAGLEIHMEVRLKANLALLVVEYFKRFALHAHGLAMNRR